MNSKAKTMLGLAALVLFLGAAAVAYQLLSKQVAPQSGIEVAVSRGGVQDANASVSAEEPLTAPDFSVLDSEGNAVKLSQLFGKPIVLNFWASWCPPCKSEMPEFDKVYRDLGEDVTFMMVDLISEGRETIEKGKAYVAEQGFAFPVYYDTEQEAGDTYGITSIPTTLFIDKNGYIITGAKGAIDEATLRKGIGMIMETGEGSSVPSPSPSADTEQAKVRDISPEEARKLLDENADAILLDVRTEAEYTEKRIPGAILIPDTEIADRAEKELPDKEAVILIYCCSGNHSRTAAEQLAAMGYTNVYDLGGITDYPYETISG